MGCSASSQAKVTTGATPNSPQQGPGNGQSNPAAIETNKQDNQQIQPTASASSSPQKQGIQ